jgi:hypothetical protein
MPRTPAAAVEFSTRVIAHSATAPVTRPEPSRCNRRGVRSLHREAGLQARRRPGLRVRCRSSAARASKFRNPKAAVSESPLAAPSTAGHGCICHGPRGQRCVQLAGGALRSHLPSRPQGLSTSAARTVFVFIARICHRANHGPEPRTRGHGRAAGSAHLARRHRDLPRGRKGTAKPRRSLLRWCPVLHSRF